MLRSAACSISRPPRLHISLAARQPPIPRISACALHASFPRRDASSSTEVDAKAEETPLPFLPRPLGVNVPPKTAPQTWEERKADLLSREKHMERRKHLVKEATKGYFHDFNALKHHGGKMWIAPKVLIREDKSLYLPDITGLSLDERQPVHTTSLCAGNITVVSMLSTRISELHAKSFVTPTIEAFSSSKHFKYVQINLQENPLKSFLVSLFFSSLRKTVPIYLQPTYLISSQNMEYLREPLGMENKHIGYVYLLDENLRVRWAGCGFARDEEGEALRNCVRVLLDRMEAEKSGSSTKASADDAGAMMGKASEVTNGV